MTSEAGLLDDDSERRGPTFEWRASTAFKIVVGFVVVVGLILVAGTRTLPAAYLLPSIAYVACLLVTARGIDARAGWALAAAPALLWILVGFGVVQFMLALAASRLELPIGAVVAAWAFRARRSVPVGSVNRRRVQAVAGTFLVANALLVVGPPLLGPAGPFAAREDDLRVTLVVDCGPATGGVPETVPVTFRWKWNRGEPFPGGSDGIGIAWGGQDTTTLDGGFGDPDAADPGTLFTLGDPPPVLGAGVWTGGASPSADLVDAFVTRYPNRITFGVDLAEQHFAPGEIVVTLRRSPAGPVAHGNLDVEAGYVHLGRWRVHNHPATACQW